MSTAYAVGHGFASRLGHTKDHHKIGTNCLPAWHTGVWQCNRCKRPGSVWNYGDMHYKDTLGSIIRVGYYIPVLDFYLVLHDFDAKKNHAYGLMIVLLHCCMEQAHFNQSFYTDARLTYIV